MIGTRDKKPCGGRRIDKGGIDGWPRKVGIKNKGDEIL
jgi:hypothetical protein